MRTSCFRFIVSAILLGILCGCRTYPTVTPQPVDNPAPPIAAGCYELGKTDVPPKAVRRYLPQYPFELKQAGISGHVAILFTVKVDGRVADVVILHASDISLGELSRAAILRWRFRPALVNGQPVDCRMMVPFDFHLSSN